MNQNLTEKIQRSSSLLSVDCCKSLAAMIVMACVLLGSYQPVAAQQTNQEETEAARTGVARIHDHDFLDKTKKLEKPNTENFFDPPQHEIGRLNLPIKEPTSQPSAVTAKPGSTGHHLPSPQPLTPSETPLTPSETPLTPSETPLENSSVDRQQEGNTTPSADLLPELDEPEQETTPIQSNWSFEKLKDRKTLPSTIQMIVSIAAISLVPAILLMTTCFIRIVVVLGILRQAIGLQQLPPNQVTTALALMMTFLIMAPTWKQVKQEAIDPYSAEGSTMTWEEAWNAGVTPVKRFMWSQIRRAENEQDFWVFYDYLPEEERSHEPTSYADIPLKVLLPAFMISELKVAFLIGIQVLLPFLILDIVVASLCNTMGLIMLPPTVVSLPLKLLLFVMVDGWNLVVAMLLNSFTVL